jgi:RNA polymerase sigma-70 factor (ECF subfamily)
MIAPVLEAGYEQKPYEAYSPSRAWKIVDRAARPEMALIERARSGDEAACESLVCKHADRLLAVARRYLRCEEDAADAVQDAFLSAFASLHSFQGGSTLYTWLHRIVVNACLMKLRSCKADRTVSLHALLPMLHDSNRHAQTDEGDGCAERPLEREELRAKVRAAIDRLPDGFRHVLLLRDIEQRSTIETARRLGLSRGAVKTRLHRARQALRSLLESELGGGQRRTADARNPARIAASNLLSI